MLVGDLGRPSYLVYISFKRTIHVIVHSFLLLDDASCLIRTVAVSVPSLFQNFDLRNRTLTLYKIDYTCTKYIS